MHIIICNLQQNINKLETNIKLHEMTSLLKLTVCKVTNHGFMLKYDISNYFPSNCQIDHPSVLVV